MVLVVVATIFAMPNSYGQTTITANMTVKGADVTVVGDVQAESGTVDGDGSVFLTGDWISLGAYPISGTDLRVVFNGTVLQFIAGDTVLIPKLVLNNSAGLQIAGTVEYLETDTLTLLSGVLDLNGNVVDLHFGQLVGEDETTYVTDSLFDGQIWAAAIVPASAPVYHQPGDLRFSLATVIDLDTVYVKRGHVPQTDLGSDVLLYYEVQSSQPNFDSVRIIIDYLSHEVNDTNNDYEIWQKEYGTWNSLQSAFPTQTSTLARLDDGWGDRFTLYSPILTSLPIDLAWFRSACRDGVVNLAWITYVEINSDYFLVERSQDGVIWEFVATIPAVGNSNESQFYLIQDDFGDNNLTYYRLTEYSLDGTPTGIAMLEQGPCNDGRSSLVYPNPTRSELNITVHDLLPYQVRVVDSYGKIVFESRLEGNQTIDLSNLSSGIYNVLVMYDLVTFDSHRVIKVDWNHT